MHALVMYRDHTGLRHTLFLLKSINSNGSIEATLAKSDLNWLDSTYDTFGTFAGSVEEFKKVLNINYQRSL